MNTVIDGVLDVLFENRDKIDNNGINYSKAVLKAFAMPDTVNSLSDEDAHRYEQIAVGRTMPPNMAKMLTKLADIGKLAALRNQLTLVPSGTACDEIVREAGFLIHTKDFCNSTNEQDIKRYVLSTLDAVIDGFLAAVNGMTDKNTQAIDLLNKIDGGCVEAKGDNIQKYIERAMKLADAGRSEQKDDLAYSVTAEFNALADEVKAPFRAAARKECEAEVRAECAKNGITDEEAIENRIITSVERKLNEKKTNDEITSLVEKKLKTEGKSFLYENLCGALRPVTTVEKKGDGDDATWTVTKLVDKQGAPILKPVSAFDIDKDFDKFVEMYMADAHLMGYVTNQTRTDEGVSFATLEDLHAEGVKEEAGRVATGKGFKAFAERVKADLAVKLDLSDDQFEDAVRNALADVRKTPTFDTFVHNLATGAYKDAPNDDARLVHLVARHVEQSKGGEARFNADMAGKALRCAQMMKNHYFKGQPINVNKAQKAIADTLQAMRKEAQEKPEHSVKLNSYLRQLMPGGRIFTDQIQYDVGQRPARSAEIAFNANMKILIGAMKHYTKTTPEMLLVNEEAN